MINFGIPTAVPVDGDIAFADLAQKVGIGANSLERVMRLLFLQKFFCEPRPGHVGHSRLSAPLAEQPGLVAVFKHLTTAGFRGGSYLAEALRRYPNSSQPTETGFPLAYGSSDPFFSFLAKNPNLAAEFNQGMVGVNTLLDRTPRDDIEGYGWAELGENATVVDVSSSITCCLLLPLFKWWLNSICDCSARRRKWPHRTDSRLRLAKPENHRSRPTRNCRPSHYSSLRPSASALL